MMLKAMGINVSAEHIAAIEKLLPEVPTRLQQAVTFLQNLGAYCQENVKELRAGQARIEKQNEEILRLLNEPKRTDIDAVGRTRIGG